jgi:hypothetical protein
VLHAWSSPLDRSYTGEALAAVPISDTRDLSESLEEMFAAAASDLADEGAALAREAGLEARALASKADAARGARSRRRRRRRARR